MSTAVIIRRTNKQSLDVSIAVLYFVLRKISLNVVHVATPIVVSPW